MVVGSSHRQVQQEKCYDAVMASPLDKLVKEKDLQRTVEQALTTLGFLWFHDRSLQHATVRTSQPGFPDICAVHPDNGVLVFIELKSETGKMRPAQVLWAAALEQSAAIYIGPVKPSGLGALINRLNDLAVQPDRHPVL